MKSKLIKWDVLIRGKPVKKILSEDFPLETISGNNRNKTLDGTGKEAMNNLYWSYLIIYFLKEQSKGSKRK